ncbi:phosphotransferase enzyme family protein, partial [Bacteroidota bacterium]
TEITPFGEGLINTTYLVVTDSKDKQNKYILQKINQYVFPEPWKVMENLSTVNKHINTNVKSSISSGDLKITQAVDTIKGQDYNLVLENKDAWRMIEYIPDTKTIKTAESREIAYEAARAFGKFASYLSALDTNLIYTTIPGYHAYSNRLEKLELSIRENTEGRVADCKNEIVAAQERRDYLMRMNHLIEGGHTPRRVTHNDTKIDNVLFDINGKKAIGVIDLDTVMPATILYDFGDMVRSSCNSTREDNPDIDSIHFKMDIFKGLAEGFLKETNSFINNHEKDNLVFGGLFFTWIQAVRFLTDYLMGDVYYKTAYPEHNLDRTKNQLAYLSLMEERRKELEDFIAG